MDSEFVNIYIEKLMAAIDKYTRADLMSQAQLEMAKKITTNLTAENEALKQTINKLEASLNKKSSKTKEDF